MQKRIIVALDFKSAASAMMLAKQLDPNLCAVKIGKELFTRAGPKFVEAIMNLGFNVFLDLKFHDIPNTVAGACEAAADLGVWMVNVHTSGGQEMLEAAANTIAKHPKRPLLVGVTLLTSLDQAAIAKIGYTGSVEENVDCLAQLSKDCGLDGVVCSAHEAGPILSNQGRNFIRVTPGIKFASTKANDQKRIMTPAEAIQNGASFLVIGRSITESDNPIAALEQANAEVQSVIRKTL